MAKETVEAIDQRLVDLDAQFKAETATIQQELDPDALALEPVEVKPKKADVTVNQVSLVWTV